jgi:hypothetical protein
MKIKLAIAALLALIVSAVSLAPASAAHRGPAGYHAYGARQLPVRAGNAAIVARYARYGNMLGVRSVARYGHGPRYGARYGYAPRVGYGYRHLARHAAYGYGYRHAVRRAYHGAAGYGYDAGYAAPAAAYVSDEAYAPGYSEAPIGYSAGYGGVGYAASGWSRCGCNGGGGLFGALGLH